MNQEKIISFLKSDLEFGGWLRNYYNYKLVYLMIIDPKHEYYWTQCLFETTPKSFLDMILNNRI